MKENFVQPLGISFQANQEMQERRSEKEIHHESISHGDAKSSHAMWNSKGQQLQGKFGALPRVHCLHTIYHFEAREVKSPMLQMMCKSELKWRSYGHLKATVPSWKGIWHHLSLMRKFLHHLSLMRKFSHWLFLMRKFLHWLSLMWKILHHTFSNAIIFTLPFSDAKIFASPFPHAKM